MVQAHNKTNKTKQIIGIKVLLWFISFFTDLEAVTWDDTLLEGLDFVAEYVLQVPFFLMTLMRYVVPTLDNLLVHPQTCLSIKSNQFLIGSCSHCSGWI